MFFCKRNTVVWSSIFPEDQHHVHIFALLHTIKFHEDGFQFLIRTGDEIVTAYLFRIEEYESQELTWFQEWIRYRGENHDPLAGFYDQIIRDQGLRCTGRDPNWLKSKAR
jgi:hypothetical protein